MAIKNAFRPDTDFPTDLVAGSLPPPLRKARKDRAPSVV